MRKYLLFTFLITFVFWGLDGVLSALGLYVHPSYSIGIVFYIIAVCAPAISAYVIMRKGNDTKQLLCFIKSSFTVRRPMAGLLLIFLFTSIRFITPVLFNETNVIGNWQQVVVNIPVMILFGGLEEIGWRGYLQSNMEKRFGFLFATLIVAAIWILWHIPLCFVQGTYQYSNSYLWFAIQLTGTAFSLAAIRRVSGGILPCIIMHAMGNSIASYGLSVFDGIGVVVSVCLQIAIAVGIVAFRPPKTAAG